MSCSLQSRPQPNPRTLDGYYPPSRLVSFIIIIIIKTGQQLYRTYILINCICQPQANLQPPTDPVGCFLSRCVSCYLYGLVPPTAIHYGMESAASHLSVSPLLFLLLLLALSFIHVQARIAQKHEEGRIQRPRESPPASCLAYGQLASALERWVLMMTAETVVATTCRHQSCRGKHHAHCYSPDQHW